MFNQVLRIGFIAAIFTFAFAAAAQGREARVDEVEVITDAPGVAVIVRGALPDGCTELGEPQQTVERNTISITLLTRRPFGAVCTQALVFYEETIPLDVTGLPPGEYEVDVNGISDTFTLESGMTGAQPGSPEETVEPQPESESTALVETVEVRLGDGHALSALVSGSLPDACIELVGYTQTNRENTIEVTLLTSRLPNARCAAAPVPVNQTLPVDVSSLAEGAYTVIVDEVTSPPFVFHPESAASENDCAIVNEGWALVRSLRDGYCISAPADLTVISPMPGILEFRAAEAEAQPLLTITAASAEGRTLEQIASESNSALETTEIGGEAALVSGMQADSDSWQAYVIYGDLLLMFSAAPDDELLTAELLQSLIGSFAFFP